MSTLRAGDRRRFHAKRATDTTDWIPRLARMADLAVLARPARVVDVGSGRGTLLRHLRGRLPDALLVGVDVQVADAPTWSSIVADLTQPLPLASGSQDVVLCGEVIEHLPDPDALLAELHRVLAPGGKLILSTPNLACWANRLLLPLGVQPLFTEVSSQQKVGRYVPLLGQGTPAEGHLRVFTRRALIETLELNGFDIDRVEGAPFFFPFPVSLVDRLATKLPSLASLLIVSATPRRCATRGWRSSA